MSGCDAPNLPVYLDNEGNYVCRCVICGRCGHHTGNSHQGHSWKLCKIQLKLHDKHSEPILKCRKCLSKWHYCCPDDCELYNEDGSKKINND